MAANNIQNIQELRSVLLEEIDALRRDPRRANQAKEIINAAGKALVSAKVEMEYSMLKGQEPDIPFMGKTSGIALKSNARLLSQG